MKSSTYTLLEAIALLDPAENPALFERLGLKLTTGETVFVEGIHLSETLLSAKGSGDPIFHMIPTSALVSFEVELKDPKQKWFSDVPTLPEILCKLRIEQKKKAA